MPNTACRIASITQPIGEANRLFSSFLAIVKIIGYTLSTKAVSITAASSHRFLVRELDEYFFQRSLIRIDLMQSPAVADCRLHQRFSRHLAFRVMHAQQAIRQRINGLHTGNLEQFLVSRWLIQAQQQLVALALLIEHVNRTVKYQLPLVDDLHMVTNHFYFRQDVGGQNYAVRAAQFLDQGTDIANLYGIKTNRWFIQNHHHGIMNNGLGDAYALLITLGKIFNQALAHVGQAATFHGNLHRFLDMTAADAMQPC